MSDWHDNAIAPTRDVGSESGLGPSNRNAQRQLLNDYGNWVTIAPGTGNVSGPGPSTVDGQVCVFNGTGGYTIKAVPGTVDGIGNHNQPAGTMYLVNGSQHVHAGTDITSGLISLNYLPQGTSGYFMKAQGALAPVYAAITAADIQSGNLSLNIFPQGTSGYFLIGQGASAPVYAALTAAMIPDLDFSKITTGLVPLAQMPQGSTSGQLLTAQGAGNAPIWSGLSAGQIPSLAAASSRPATSRSRRCRRARRPVNC